MSSQAQSNLSSSAKYCILNITGWSMEPLIKKGDKVVVDRSKRDFEFGDIVVVSGNSKVFVHRLVAKDSHGAISFYTKGDASIYWDSQDEDFLDGVNYSDLEGTVVAILRKSGERINLMSDEEKKTSKKVAYFSRLHFVFAKVLLSLYKPFRSFGFFEQAPDGTPRCVENICRRTTNIVVTILSTKT